jgi:hypothetical protein
MLTHEAVIEDVTRARAIAACVVREIAMALHAVACDRELRFVDSAADRDDPSVDDRSRMQKRVAPDDDYIAVYAPFDHDVATENDDALSICGIARQYRGRRRGCDEPMRRSQHVREAMSE